VNAARVFSRATEWALRRKALREARAAVVPRGDRRDRALCQTRLLLEMGRRVAEPVERLPPGSRPAVRLGLYRQAAYWALAAALPGARDGELPLTFEAAWTAADPDRLRRAVPDEATRDLIRHPLADRSRPDPLTTTDADAETARVFVEELLGELEAPRRRVARVLVHRWLRIGFLAVALAGLAWGVHRISLGPNLLAGKPFRTSTSWNGCAGDAGCRALLFHTDPEFNPWVEFDLGAPKTFHRLEVTNRRDCCTERAVPLVAEVGNDRVAWKEIARHDDEFFATWTATFRPTTARYLRLRVARHSTFHLEDVALR